MYLGVVGARTRVEALRVARQTLLAHWLTGSLEEIKHEDYGSIEGGDVCI